MSPHQSFVVTLLVCISVLRCSTAIAQNAEQVPTLEEIAAVHQEWWSTLMHMDIQLQVQEDSIQVGPSKLKSELSSGDDIALEHQFWRVNRTEVRTSTNLQTNQPEYHSVRNGSILRIFGRSATNPGVITTVAVYRKSSAVESQFDFALWESLAQLWGTSAADINQLAGNQFADCELLPISSLSAAPRQAAWRIVIPPSLLQPSNSLDLFYDARLRFVGIRNIKSLEPGGPEFECTRTIEDYRYWWSHSIAEGNAIELPTKVIESLDIPFIGQRKRTLTVLKAIGNAVIPPELADPALPNGCKVSEYDAPGSKARSVKIIGGTPVLDSQILDFAERLKQQQSQMAGGTKFNASPIADNSMSWWFWVLIGVGIVTSFAGLRLVTRRAG